MCRTTATPSRRSADETRAPAGSKSAIPRILSVIGTRPEAIKMAPVIRALRRRGGCDHRLALTGQHTDMVAPVLDAFGIESDYDLELMRPGQTLYDIGHGCLDGLRRVMEDFRPDVTIVQGDTATVFFAAVVAFFERGRLAHVEAGLRSHSKWSPFPEEMLRRMTDTVSDFCFAPTPAAAANLTAEGVDGERIFVTGNTVVDALQHTRSRPLPVEDPLVARLTGAGATARDRGRTGGGTGATARVERRASADGQPSRSNAGADRQLSRSNASADGQPSGSNAGAGRRPSVSNAGALDDPAPPPRLVLLTAHRRESFGEPLAGVFAAVAELADRHRDIAVVYPVHPNPRVREPALRILGSHPRVHLTDPLGYGDLLAVLGRAALVLTDSGGIQEEAPAFGVHTLVLRDVTERPEAVQAGAATLVGTDGARILAEAEARLAKGAPGPPPANPYGDGRAGQRIADVLLASLTGSPRRTRDWDPGPAASRPMSAARPRIPRAP